MSSLDIYLEIQRKKTHLMLQAKETTTIEEIKKMIEGILKVKPSHQILKYKTSSELGDWMDTQNNQTLASIGFQTKTAKADEPGTIALILPEDNGIVHIDPLSSPPPLPEAMRHRDQDYSETTS